MFRHGRTSNEKPAITSSQTVNSFKSPKSILKIKTPQQERNRFYDEQSPTLTSPNPTSRSGYQYYQDDAVTSKTPIKISVESSGNDYVLTSKRNTPSSSDTESDEGEVVEFTPTDQNPETILTKSGSREVVEVTPTDRNPKGKSTLQKSKSLELNSSQAGRALETFKVFNKQDLRAKSNPAPSPKNVNKETEEATQKGLEKRRGRPRKRDNPTVGANLDAGKAKTVVKPLTRSREKATHSQPQQLSVQTTSPKESQLITNTQMGSSS